MRGELPPFDIPEIGNTVEILKLELGDGLVGKVFVRQVWRPELDSPEPS